jgi:hypothetical protein
MKRREFITLLGGTRSRGSRSHYRFNYFFTRHPAAW